MPGDWVDRTVQELWQKEPGMGIKAMMDAVLERLRQQHSDNDVGTPETSSTKIRGVSSPQQQSSTSHVAASSLPLDLVNKPPPASFITKARIKQAKAWIPFRQLPSESPSLTLNDHQQHFVESKLQERLQLRVTRDYDKADTIQKMLEAMGVEVDNFNKTWKLVRPPPQQLSLPEMNGNDPAVMTEDVSQTQLTNGTAPKPSSSCCCKFCGKSFASRNHVFKHLRDPTSGCGTAILVSGLEIPEPPSLEDRRQRQEERQSRRRQCKGSNTQTSTTMAPNVTAEQSLWIGDLPLPWTTPRKNHYLLRALLFRCMPRNVPQPWIKRVVRKAYRKERNGVYHGYAIVVFRDAPEAKTVCRVLHEHRIDPQQVIAKSNNQNEKQDVNQLPSFVLKVKAAEDGETFRATTSKGNVPFTPSVEPGQDPPLIEQLRPLPPEELRRRISRLEGRLQENTTVTETTNTNDDDVQVSLERLCRLYETSDIESIRPFVYQQGRLIPTALRESLLSILQSLRWPAKKERDHLSSERYLVLPSNMGHDRFYQELRDACHALIQWADPSYSYSGIAVTKNFVASPHIDHRDQSFQYAVSLGDVVNGGELCVEGQKQDTTTVTTEIVNVVTTLNRIARVDGRHVHWVRTWQGGDRYSLIFYDTSNRHSTPLLPLGIDKDWCPPESDSHKDGNEQELSSS